MAADNAETRRLNSGQFLYNSEHGSRIIVRRIKKLNKKLVLNSSAVLINQVCIHIHIYIRE